MTMLMVDWFQPWPVDIQSFRLEDKEWPEVAKELIQFLKQKRYCLTGKKYLVITDFGESLTFSGGLP